MKNSRREINRLTNNSDETDIALLISGDKVFSIPYFQRAYKWKTEKLKQLDRDILNIVDGETDFHFLGAIIIHGRKNSPSDPGVYEVIDGQQRLTTLFLYLAATIKTLCQYSEHDEAQSLFLKYLIIGRNVKLISNFKLHSCKEDRAQLNAVYQDLLNDKKFAALNMAYKISQLPSTGDSKGILWNNYKHALRFLKTQFEQGGLDRIRQVIHVSLQKMSVVQIDVWDPTNGPKIFDSLNSRQEPMTIGDLVRNEVFSKIADEEPLHVENIDHNYWQPFYNKFKSVSENQFDNYFFPYGLTQNPALKKSEVYDYLRNQWEEIGDPKDIIDTLALYQNAFLDLVRGTNYQEQKPNVHNAFKCLTALVLPSSTYPFLMQLSVAIKNNTITEVDGIEVIKVIESFLTKRAVCGIEPTGLHAVFKRLWDDCGNNVSVDNVIIQIKKHKTVTWPSTLDFQSAIQNRPIYNTSICSYFLLEYNKSLGGDHPSDIPWIEHVLPDKPDKEWFTVFTKDEHERLKDLVANLLSLSQRMNIQLSNKPYFEKKEKYRNDSMFKSTRDFAKEFDEWTPTTLLKRSEIISDWAAKRWKY